MAQNTYTPEFKVKIVLEVLQGERELREIAAENNLNHNIVRNWEKEFLENASSVFADQSKDAKRSKERGGSMFKILVEKYGEDFSWSELKNERGKTFEARLAVELAPKHSLYSLRNKLTAVAKNERNDDVLFSDGKQYYNIHLTWGKGTEIYPRYSIIRKEELLSFLENDYLFG